MERRWTARTHLVIDVEVICDLNVFSLTTRNIGLGGVFLAATDAIPLALGKGVKLIFKLDETFPEDAPCICARIVRQDSLGLGLMFRDFDAVAFRSLQKIIRFKNGLAF